MCSAEIVDLKSILLMLVLQFGIFYIQQDQSLQVFYWRSNIRVYSRPFVAVDKFNYSTENTRVSVISRSTLHAP